ncbi:MAG TPA: Stp1/IreP family PP2C-type Ser/Thr phosphatase [Egibacteraceae bacterium]|nr:Stp1/IreP family PP2C-type Ser/Thr phosphatase [Egibacteraceae bacterium]
MRISAHAATDVGRVREGNEDSLFAGRAVFAVADGMGGHQAGEVASEAALRPIAALDGQEFAAPEAAQDALVEAVVDANRSVVSQARSDPSLRGMGTTLTAVLVRDNHLHIAHVGDSRAYLLRGGRDMTQLTTDHTLVEQLIREGRLARSEAAVHPQRSVITRAIGVDQQVQVDSLPPLQLQPGDQVLLCSDGLTGPVDDHTIAEVLAGTADGDTACRQLIEAANAAGGPDNITVVLLRLEGDPAAAARTPLPGTKAATLIPDPTEEIASMGGTDAARRELRPGDVEAVTIRTRDDEAHDFTDAMARYGDRREVQRGALGRSRGVPRWAVMLGAAAILAGVLGGGAFLLLQRAYWLGIDEGRVTVFHGMPQDVAGIPLHWVAERSDLRAARLPDRLQDRLREGVALGSLEEGLELVETYEDDLEAEERRRRAREAVISPSPSPSPSPTASPSPATSPAPGAVTSAGAQPAP